jgi:hypothetical protein
VGRASRSDELRLIRNQAWTTGVRFASRSRSVAKVSASRLSPMWLLLVGETRPCCCCTNTDEVVTPDALAEVTLVASPSELRRIADFLSAAASSMDRMCAAYSHEHLSDWDDSFEPSPQFVVTPLPSDEG